MRRPALLAVLLALVLPLAACGTPVATTQTGASTKHDPGAFPVTVHHRYGTTTIRHSPQRVVTVGLTDQDAALAVGVRPVGVRRWFGRYPYAIWPWAQSERGDATPRIVGDARSYDLARIRALRPGLILAMTSDITAAQYRQLSAIAPVVAQPVGYADFAAPWPVTTKLAGRALGRTIEAKRVIGRVRSNFRTVRTAHPGFARHTALMATLGPASAVTVYTAKDPRSQVLRNLGFQVPATIAGAPPADADATEVRLTVRQLGRVDVDRLLWIVTPTQRARVQSDPQLAQVPAGRGRAGARFLAQDSPPIGAALRFDTALSLSFAAKEAAPLLVAPKG
jgi:iron complex transport system substrate-binding protein